MSSHKNKKHKQEKKQKETSSKKKLEALGLALTALTAGVFEGTIVGTTEGILDWVNKKPAQIEERQKQDPRLSPYRNPSDRNDPAGAEPTPTFRYTVEHDTGAVTSWSNPLSLRAGVLGTLDAASFFREPFPTSDRPMCVVPPAKAENAIEVDAKFATAMPSFRFALPREAVEHYLAHLQNPDPTLDLSTIKKVTITREPASADAAQSNVHTITYGTDPKSITDETKS